MGSEEEAYFTFVRESDNPFHQRTVFLSVEDLISSLLNKNQLRRPFALATKPVVNGYSDDFIGERGKQEVEHQWHQLPNG